eukprot:TRINITY_DN5115_c0_g1_i1.p1 TRINITY_DN5115_c0_g1~~TRINITY_DN5115_c0_g1_i1.p1  ORF type:complete len:330 (+),score=29.16 TRINITY_DN5115_c0_g1_i1:69-1058(+)
MGCCAASARQHPDDKEESVPQGKKLDQSERNASEDEVNPAPQDTTKKEEPPNLKTPKKDENESPVNPLTAEGRQGEERRGSDPNNTNNSNSNNGANANASNKPDPDGAAAESGAQEAGSNPPANPANAAAQQPAAGKSDERPEASSEKPNEPERQESTQATPVSDEKKKGNGELSQKDSSRVLDQAQTSSSNLASSKREDEPREERVFDERKLRLRRWFDGIAPSPVPTNGNAQPEHLALTAENIEKNRYYLQKLARAQYEESLGITGHSFRARTPAHTSSFRGGDMGASLAAVPSGRIDRGADGPVSESNRFVIATQSANNISATGAQ